MQLDANEVLFGKIYPYIEDDNVTDIKWNGRNLWINDLNKGRYIAKDDDGNPLKLDDEWTDIFTTKLANAMNINFNNSRPSLMAETDELRIQAVHEFVSGEHKMAIAIRKTPSIARLNTKDLVKDKYMDEMTHKLLPCIIRARLSGAIIGDVGAGKTELEKYLAQFIPEIDGIITVEDTLEMKLAKIYPEKDIYSIKLSAKYTAVDAIRDALRLLTKWLILSEARGREIQQVMEAASTGCTALTSIHAENTWEIPDRMLNMAGTDARDGFESDIYAFFDYAIKVKAQITSEGIKRCIDQISFFDRTDGVNSIIVFFKDGKLTGKPLPTRLIEKFTINNETDFLNLYYQYFGENNQPIPSAFGIREAQDTKEYGTDTRSKNEDVREGADLTPEGSSINEPVEKESVDNESLKQDPTTVATSCEPTLNDELLENSEEFNVYTNNDSHELDPAQKTPSNILADDSYEPNQGEEDPLYDDDYDDEDEDEQWYQDDE